MEPFSFVLLRIYMSRPKFITENDISRWANQIDNDKSVPKGLINSPVIREVCFAGLWLCEELNKLNCPDLLITRIQYTAGKLSFGKDVWEVHQQMLDGYKNNQLDFAMDSENLN
jgi:hypothetical protein